uniref:Uncharacterized protein n=1 Tax=Solanum lycopersicum TaxID=4081 RepID=K4B5K5_SOLLC
MSRQRGANFANSSKGFITVLDEVFLRVVFWFAVNCLGWSFIPIRIKTIVTSLLQSLGGIHSGCAISSIVWRIYALIQTLNDKGNASPEIVGVAFAILSLLFLSSLAAFPLVRHLHHNFFKRIHHFVEWIALALLWIFITLTVSYDPKTKSYNNAKICSKLIEQQEFLFTLAGVKAGILGRISPSPLSEWHAFGIISNGKAEHMMLAGAVGDFTKTLVSNPPSHLWVRQVHFAEMSVDAARKWGAEVVIVTSNPEGRRDVVNACKKSGVPAFGPIWDS